MNKSLEIYKIPIDNQKSIYTMPAPINDLNKSFYVEELKLLGVDNVISLLSDLEIKVHGLSDEQNTYLHHDIEYHHFPIIDFGIPKDKEGFQGLVRNLTAKIKNGQSLAIHCKAGIGRSSLLAAAILIHFGHSFNEVFAYISEIRGLNVPDKLSQKDWIESNINLFK